jgi:hypothetical protein
VGVHRRIPVFWRTYDWIRNLKHLRGFGLLEYIIGKLNVIEVFIIYTLVTYSNLPALEDSLFGFEESPD